MGTWGSEGSPKSGLASLPSGKVGWRAVDTRTASTLWGLELARALEEPQLPTQGCCKSLPKGQMFLPPEGHRLNVRVPVSERGTCFSLQRGPRAGSGGQNSSYVGGEGVSASHHPSDPWKFTGMHASV